MATTGQRLEKAWRNLGGARWSRSRLRPLGLATLVAHVLAHGQVGVPPVVLLIQFGGNALQAVVATLLLRRLTETPWRDTLPGAERGEPRPAVSCPGSDRARPWPRVPCAGGALR